MWIFPLVLSQSNCPPHLFQIILSALCLVPMDSKETSSEEPENNLQSLLTHLFPRDPFSTP